MAKSASAGRFLLASLVDRAVLEDRGVRLPLHLRAHACYQGMRMHRRDAEPRTRGSTWPSTKGRAWPHLQDRARGRRGHDRIARRYSGLAERLPSIDRESLSSSCEHSACLRYSGS